MSHLGGGAGRSGCGSSMRTRNACTSISSMEKGGGGSCGSSSSSNTFAFPRLSLRSLLLNTPWSLRTRSKRVRTSATTHKVSVEQENSTDSSGIFNENGTSDILSIRKNLARRKSSQESKGTSRGGSCSSEGGACANISGIGSQSAQTSSNDGMRRECPLCLQEVAVDLFPNLISCPHSSCLPCLKQYLTVEINESRVNVSCPQCNELLNPADIHQILDNAILSYKFEDFMLRRVLSMDPDTRWCPAPDCGYAVIASGCAGCPKLKCERPGCESYFCYHCKAEWHPNQTCDMARAQRSPNIILSSFNYLHDIQNNDDVKSCPRCQVLIMKMDDGSCNHMTCSVCGAEFCWLCMKEISDLHYLSPSGCTFWGKKPWSRKKKILWQLGTLVGAPLGIGLVAGLAVPAMIIGIPIWVGRKLHARYATSNRHHRNIAIVGGVTASALISPVLAGLAVSIGVPILLAYVYGVVPISLCRSGGCGVTTSASGVRIAFDDENDMVFGIPGRQSESSHVGGGTASIGEVSCGASLSADSAAHILTGESDRESASNTAIAPASLTASIASSCLSRSHRLEVHVDMINIGGRSTASGETVSLAISEHSDNNIDTENASVTALAGSLLQYKVTECESATGSTLGGGDSASGVLEGAGGISSHITSLYIHSRVPTSASETSSAILTNDCGENSSGTDLRLDSVSAIINAGQLSRRGVTFMGDADVVSDHVAVTLDDDEESLSQYKEDALSSYSNDKEDINSTTYEPNSEDQESIALNETGISRYQKEVSSQSEEKFDLGYNRALSSELLINPNSSAVPLVHGNNLDDCNRKGSITKSSYTRRRSSSAEASDRSPRKPMRSESFPKLESQ